jgi:hypothetical protein
MFASTITVANKVCVVEPSFFLAITEKREDFSKD